MSIAATNISLPGGGETIEALGNLWVAHATLALSGSYATGGDAFDASSVFSGPANVTTILMVDVSGGAGYTFEYDKTNKKLKVFSAAGTELAAGAYPAALTGDTLIVAQVWGK